MQVYLALQSRLGATTMIAKKAELNHYWKGKANKRSSLVNQAGQWALPGGSLNHGEQPVAGALREFFEETGCDLSHVMSIGAVCVETEKYRLVVVRVAELDNIVEKVKVNLRETMEHADVPHPLNSLPASGRPWRNDCVVDWELQDAQVVETSQLAKYLGVPQPVHPKTTLAIERSDQETQNIDWYRDMAVALSRGQ